MRPGAPLIRTLAVLCLALAPGLEAAGVRGEQRYEDATPSGIPPGFEPVDVSEDMPRIEERRRREMQRDVDREFEGRHVTPERRIRARYGGATWNLYDPFH